MRPGGVKKKFSPGRCVRNKAFFFWKFFFSKLPPVQPWANGFFSLCVCWVDILRIFKLLQKFFIWKRNEFQHVNIIVINVLDFGCHWFWLPLILGSSNYGGLWFWNPLILVQLIQFTPFYFGQPFPNIFFRILLWRIVMKNFQRGFQKKIAPFKNFGPPQMIFSSTSEI